MNRQVAKSLPLALLVFFFLSTSADAFFKCKDSHGQWHFSDTTAGFPDSCLRGKDETSRHGNSKKSNLEKEKIEKLAKQKARALELEKEAKADKEKKKREAKSKARKKARDKTKAESQTSTIAKARLRLAKARAGAMQNSSNRELDPMVATIIMIVTALLSIVFLGGIWKTFKKAGQPGWAVLIPIYNFVVAFKMAGKPWWWTVLLFIPFVNLIVLIIAYIEIAKRFGKSTLFAFGLLFLGIIFFPILGFGKAKYKVKRFM